MSHNSISQIYLKFGTVLLLSLAAFILALIGLPDQITIVKANNGDPTAISRVDEVTQPIQARQELTAAHVIDPPEGRPKLDLSTKIVTPELVNIGSNDLVYVIELKNTGAYTATNATLIDPIPDNTTYNNDVESSSGVVNVVGGNLLWSGQVGFNSSVVISYSVKVDGAFEGIILNTATISDPLLLEPVNKSARTIVTDGPLLEIGKSAEPVKPGANKLLTYTLVVTNIGQTSGGLLDIEVRDEVPLSTTFYSVGPDGYTDTNTVIFSKTNVSLNTNETTEFHFTVRVDDVPTQTVLTNDNYQVKYNYKDQISTGSPYTLTVVAPTLNLFKEIEPDPPGSNRSVTYTISLLNQGSLATDLVITDRIPANFTYVSGGDVVVDDVVSWTLDSLATNEAASFSFSGYISDVMDIALVNADYRACSAEGICVSGDPFTKTIQGPNFEVSAIVDPIVKKPGGGGGATMTPTLVIRNLGPGNALDATALVKYYRLSVSNNDDVEVIPSVGTLTALGSCGDKCNAYSWLGDLDYGEVITIVTTINKDGDRGVSTIGGEEGTVITVTGVITDQLANMTTDPITGTTTATITHFANLIPRKSSAEVVGPGQLLTYTINVVNSGFTTDDPPLPWLVDPIPANTTFVNASDGGVTTTLSSDQILTGTTLVSGATVISWTLEKMGTGSTLTRTFTVKVNDDVISGTELVNSDYWVFWFENEITGTGIVSNTNPPVTTLVQEVGLIDSYKEVAPSIALPGDTLTYTLYVVNSSGIPLTDVIVDDLLPWEESTYQFDVTASSGTIVEEDDVSVHWQGDVAAFSEELITLTVQIDSDFEGELVNTMVISHSELVTEIVRTASVYASNEPVLKITKSASPVTVEQGDELEYTLKVSNLGQAATLLVISDTIPANTSYVDGSASGNGQLINDHVEWTISDLDIGESRTFSFRVKVEGSSGQIVNSNYGVKSAEGVIGIGVPLVTNFTETGSGDVYLPIIMK